MPIAALPAILSAIKTVGSILGGVSAGYQVYQSLSTPNQPQTTALATVPRTRSELERRAAYTMAVTPGWQDGQGGQFFRRRRMNVLNPRALNRSIRRVKGFAKFAKRVGSFTDPGKSYRLKGFGKRRRR